MSDIYHAIISGNLFLVFPNIEPLIHSFLTETEIQSFSTTSAQEADNPLPYQAQLFRSPKTGREISGFI